MKITKLITLALVASLVTSCTPSEKAKLGAVGRAAIDCATPLVESLAASFGPLIENRLIGAADSQGKIGADALRSAGATLVTNEAKCVFATTVAAMLKGKSTNPNAPQSASVQLDGATLLANFNVIRAEKLDGATFHTTAGDL